MWRPRQKGSRAGGFALFDANQSHGPAPRGSCAPTGVWGKREDATMTDGYPDDSESRGDSRWSPEFVWSTLLVLIIAAGVLLWAYLGPRTLSPAYRATETPAILTPTLSGR